MKKRLALSAISAMLFSVSYATDIWRWTDPETGEPVYGGQPPAGIDAETVQIRKNPSHADVDNLQTGTSADRIRSRVEELRDQRLLRDERKREAQEKKLTTAQLSQACQSASSNLETLTGGGRTAIVEGGESRVLTEAERQSYIASTRKFIGERCVPGGSSR